MRQARIGTLRINKGKNMAMGRKDGYIVTRSDLQTAFEMKLQGHTDRAIYKVLGITEGQWVLNKPRFEGYFRINGLKRKLVTKHDRSGRPTGSYKLDPETVDLELIHDLVIANCTEKKIAKMLGVSQDTFITYKKKYPAIQETIDTAKTKANAKVLRSMFNRATGMKYKDLHFASYLGDITSKEYYKYLPPDVSACMSWLINNMGWTRDGNKAQLGDPGLLVQALDNALTPTKEEEKQFKNFDKEDT